jgi:type IV pilus assembly protein PilQ
LKLRQVPWDQALIMVMRAKKLGYTRIGNILRIANLSDLKQEEDDAIKLAREQNATQALKVRMFPVNYGKVEELEKKVKDFLTERGKVVSDPRTNYLVVSDIEESLNRVAKLIASLDIQPPQVLIEGKIVEAKDSFKRSIGFTWNVAGQAIPLGKKTLNMTPQLEVNPLVKGLKSDTTGIGSFGLNLGVLDFLGQLDAALVLAERDETVKVISSPRIVTMTNEKANINEKTQIPIKRTILNGAQAQTTYDFKDLNLKLEVTPQITSDGSVIMQVEVMREVQGAALNFADQVPSINSRQATTRVLVRNGQTAIIGGIYQNDVSEMSEGVPYLKDLPGLGFLFRNRVTSREKQELLVFLTPRILSQVDAQSLPAANGGM